MFADNSIASPFHPTLFLERERWRRLLPLERGEKYFSRREEKVGVDMAYPPLFSSLSVPPLPSRPVGLCRRH